MSLPVVARPTNGRRGRWLVHLPLAVLVVFSLFPVALLVMNAFKTDVEIKGFPLRPPTVWHPENFVDAWQAAEYTRAFTNSVVVTLATVLGVCVLGGLAAYGLTRLRLPGSEAIITYYLVAFTIPAQLYLVPLFFAWVRLGLTESLPGLVLIYLAIYQPFAIFLLRAYLMGLPPELEDAARVDGASEIQVLWHIVLPLAMPAFLTVAVIVGTWTWNEFLFAATMLHKPELLTAALKFVVFTGMFDVNFAQQSAAGVMVILPVVVLFLALQRTFVQGMISGGLK
jgi:raffinose/stachyose/melibiose transport system permease protein